MKELTLREIQLVSLGVLKEIRDFCSAHGIRYFISYGTLLGAVRHRGFIPWDDDIDIMMPRPDYERFIDTYKAPASKVYSYEHDGCRMAFARVCDTKRTLMDYGGTSWCYGQSGIYIDVFPLDGTENGGGGMSVRN